MTAVSRAVDAATAATLAQDAPLAWIYVSFADGIRGGNPAGVVLSATPLATEHAQAIAAVLSVPTTGFVVAPSPHDRQIVDVRFFTPAREIEACGHVAVAVAMALIECGIWRWGEDVTLRAAGGDFTLKLRDGIVAMTQRLAFVEPSPVSWLEVRAAIGSIDEHPSLPLACAGTGLRHLIVPVPRVEQVATLEVDAALIAALAQRAEVDTICVFTPLEQGRARMRDLCAAIGAVEEAASGTTAATLALYLHLADSDWLRNDELVVIQGVEIERPSRLEISVSGRDVAVVRGQARKLLAGTLAPSGEE
jgi:PhzF family phenazine biosynthesis protein